MMRLEEEVRDQIFYIERIVGELRAAVPPYGPARIAESLEKSISAIRSLFEREIGLVASDVDEVQVRSKVYLKVLALRGFVWVEEGG